jgi:hypothetical protein
VAIFDLSAARMRVSNIRNVTGSPHLDNPAVVAHVEAVAGVKCLEVSIFAILSD